MIDSTPVFAENTHQFLQDWRRRYEALGFTPIPLVGKLPFDRVSWKTTPPAEQWRQAGPNFKGNIGIVMGNGQAVIDADDYETSRTVDYGLHSRGYVPPTVLSPHGNHFCIQVTNVPEQFNFSKLVKGVYNGELRVRNSYVVAPCSRVDEIPYRWERGTPEAWKSQPVVEWNDLL